jgi:hypothetical protein
MRRYLLLLVVLLELAIPAYSQFWDGNELVKYLRSYEMALRKDPKTNYDEAASYSAFVVGVHDSRREELCTPPAANVGQIGAVVARFLNSHPETWNQGAAHLVVRALKEAFPCARAPR